RAMLERIIAEKWLTARGVFALWPAQSVGDDVVVRHDGGEATLHFLRQQVDKPADRPDFCLADFIAPRDSGRQDWIGMFAVTAGIGIEPHLERFQADHDDYNAIMLKALADRLAEAFAERLHQRVRTEYWGYAPDEALDNEALIAERYRGIRPAPGYPACPEHSEKATLFRLLDAERNAGMTLTESFAMLPTAAVSGYYFSHPRSQYFVVGRVSTEQAKDYARRKGVELAQVERWLASNLDYDPEEPRTHRAGRRGPRTAPPAAGGLPDQVVGHLVFRVGVGVVFRRRIGVDLERDRFGEDLLRPRQVGRGHQAVAAIDLDHAQLAGIERAQLFLVDVDALDLAAVLEMAGDLGLRVVEHLALQERLQLRPRLAPPAHLLLAFPLGAQAFLLLALGTDGIGLGQVDVLARAAAPGALAPTLRRRRLLAGATGRPGTLWPLRRPGRLRRRLEAQAQQLVAQGVAHRHCISNAGVAARARGRPARRHAPVSGPGARASTARRWPPPPAASRSGPRSAPKSPAPGTPAASPAPPGAARAGGSSRPSPVPERPPASDRPIGDPRGLDVLGF